MVAIATKRRLPVSKAIPAMLIYEEWDGKPVYYRGYRDVLSGKKTAEEIMSCSDLRGVLVAILNIFIGTNINRKKYLIATNEVGLHMATKSNLANDIALFERERVKTLKGKYFDAVPTLVIEVDLKADTSDFTGGDTGYFAGKAQKMLDFGVERMVWILTDAKKIFVASKDDKTWYITDWSEDVLLIDNCVLNLKKLLDEEEIDY